MIYLNPLKKKKEKKRKKKEKKMEKKKMEGKKRMVKEKEVIYDGEIKRMMKLGYYFI